jgi:hypothetical protein
MEAVLGVSSTSPSHIPGLSNDTPDALSRLWAPEAKSIPARLQGVTRESCPDRDRSFWLTMLPPRSAFVRKIKLGPLRVRPPYPHPPIELVLWVATPLRGQYSYVVQERKGGVCRSSPSLPPYPSHTTGVPQGWFPGVTRRFPLRVGGVWGVGCEGRRNDGMKPNTQILSHHRYPPPRALPLRSRVANQFPRSRPVPANRLLSLFEEGQEGTYIVLPMVTTLDHPNPP